jgi:holo-[acyl-carrier protein] synthase
MGGGTGAVHQDRLQSVLVHLPLSINTRDMIGGLGIDMIEVERVTTKISKNNGFRELVFSQKEIDYCEARAHKFEHYAVRFAAKEAFLKALGTGWTSGTAFNEIEVSNNGEGKPLITLLGQTATLLNKAGITNIFVSLSHLKTIASAVVIIEK